MSPSSVAITELVDIVVPVYGALKYLRPCVKAILDNTEVLYVLWLCDDCSPPGSGAKNFLNSISDPRVRIYLSQVNLGFGQICNKGVSLGKAPFVCVLNSDTQVQPGWLSAMLANMGDPRIAMVGAKLIYPPCGKQPQLKPGNIPGHIQHAGIFFGRDKLPHEPFLNLPADNFQVNRRIQVGAVTHACALIRRSEWGDGYDPRYEKGAFEDVDMCLGFAERGLEIIYEPDAVVWHWQGASYNHSESNANLAKLSKRWRGKIIPALDFATKEAFPKPRQWWKENSR